MLKRRDAEAACTCYLCTSMLRSSDLKALALIEAQQINKHPPLCGTDLMPCKRCEEVARSVERDGALAIRERAGCTLAWRTDEADMIAAEQAELYFAAIEPGRVALWDVPVWLSDVAKIGDMVRAKAEKEIYDAASNKGGAR